MEGTEVEVVREGLVVPATPRSPPTHHLHLFLSSLDLFWRDFHYNRRVLFYSPHGQQEPGQGGFTRRLRHSLAQVLVAFYPAAGRLSAENQSRPTILCNDAGVQFLEARVNASLAGFAGLDYPPGPFLNKLAPWEHHDPAHIYAMPLLSIQVTEFTCGSVALGFAHSHVLGDGHSMWHFMKSWGECARDVPISLPPVHERTALRVEKPSEAIAFVRLPEAEGLHGGGAAVPTEPLVERVFHCSAGMIRKLKEEAGTGASEGRPFTSFEALCAHFWKRVTKARELRSDDLVCFGVVANMRNRLSQQLGDAYFGNAVIFDNTFATADQVLSESLAATCSRVRQAVEGASAEAYMWAFIHWLELHGNTFGAKFKGLKGIPTKATSSPRFPVRDVDFGRGPPCAVRAAKIKGDGELVLFQSIQCPSIHDHSSLQGALGNVGVSNGVDVCVPLNPRASANLILDTSLLLPV